MRSAIKEYIEPSSKEKQELWEKAIFVFDTNVLLNHKVIFDYLFKSSYMPV